MRSLSLILPWPPSVNKIWRAVAGRVVLSLVARQYAKAAANALPTGRVVPIRGRVAVTMLLCPPAKLANKPWDVANREKIVCDVLTKQRIWLDDSQIDVLLMARGAPAGDGHLELLIQELDEPLN